MFYVAQPFRQRREVPKKDIRALVADDSPVALVAICSYLENLGPISVVGTARSGYELLQKAEELRPDLAITDLRMPSMSGLECTLHLRHLLPATRVIVLTEMEGSFARNACLEAGADACVHKSDVPAGLTAALRRLFPKVLGNV
jgi:DNA-binding NarL/FixJ family response regulator